ncbi:hypothetical protein K8R26_25370 [Escherichia coli]|uniref:hypothetical protein n=1 Tax=Escherichia coli TaxID=562 RepID=UPI0040688286
MPSQFANAANAILVNMVSGYYRMYKSAPSSSAILDMLKRAKRDKTIREELFADVVAAFKRILAEKLSDTSYMVDRYQPSQKSVAFDDALIKAAELKEKGDFQGRWQSWPRFSRLDRTKRPESMTTTPPQVSD